MDHMYEVRDRLGTDISEKHSLLKEMILRAEDSIAIDEMCLIHILTCLHVFLVGSWVESIIQDCAMWKELLDK